MFKLYTSTFLKWAKCHKILKNEQRNLKPTKIPAKFKKSNVFWLSFEIFRSFSKVSRALYLFWGFNGILVVLKVSIGFVVVLGAFLSFFRVLGYFGYLWCILVMLAVLRGSFSTFVGIYQFFDILEIFVGKIICFDKKKKKKPQKSLEYPLYSQNHQNTLKTKKCPKKKNPWNVLVVQNSMKSFKTTKITQKPLKWPKYHWKG